MPRWVHWSPGAVPAANNITFEMWPEMSEFAASELTATAFTYGDGSTAGLYSADTAATTDRHMRWAKDYGIDGVFVQRFLSEVTTDPVFKQFRDEVTIHLMAAAEAHGRVFAIEYDISGATEATLVTDLENDWKTVGHEGDLDAAAARLAREGWSVAREA